MIQCMDLFEKESRISDLPIVKNLNPEILKPLLSFLKGAKHQLSFENIKAFFLQVFYKMPVDINKPDFSPPHDSYKWDNTIEFYRQEKDEVCKLIFVLKEIRIVIIKQKEYFSFITQTNETDCLSFCIYFHEKQAVKCLRKPELELVSKAIGILEKD